MVEVKGVDVVEVDVLIIGGGVAGCLAAHRAREQGAKVRIVDKTRSIRRSGDAGRGLAFLTTYLDLGEDWDTPKAFSDWYCDVSDGLVDMDVAQHIAVEPLPRVNAVVEKLGVPLRDPGTGEYKRVDRMWTPGPIVVEFDGEDLKPTLTDAAVAAGAEIDGGVHITSLLTDAEGSAVGAIGFDMRTCELRVYAARAVIVATGNAERVIFNSPRRDPFNTYHRPYHGATGFTLATKAGAAAASLEFLGTFLFPRGFAAGAMGNLLEAGGRLVNGRGESVADLPDDTDEREFGYGILAKAARESFAGRGPLYIDCRDIPADRLADLKSYISYDAPLFLEFLEQSDLALETDPIEFEVFHGTWSATASPKGVVVDEHCGAGVPGLFVAGDLATPCYALSGSLTTGYIAGEAAAAHAADAPAPQLQADAVAAERARIYAPLNRPEGVAWRRFEHELQDVMTKYVGTARTGVGLEQALAYLQDYRQVEDQLSVENGHELMRAHEAIDLRLFDEMMTAAALARTESRFRFLMGHYRTDHPHKDQEGWLGVATIASHDGTDPHVELRDMNPEWRAGRLASLATTGTEL